MNNEEKLRRLLSEFRSKYPMTIGWRLEKNSKIVLKHLYDDEEILYAFYAQKNDNPFNILGTGVIVLTNKRLVIGRDRVVFGYFFDSITPDMFSDLKVKSGDWWLVTGNSDNNYQAYAVQSSGYISSFNASSSKKVRPVIVLNNNVMIKSGNGSLDKPFKLK